MLCSQIPQITCSEFMSFFALALRQSSQEITQTKLNMQPSICRLNALSDKPTFLCFSGVFCREMTCCLQQKHTEVVRDPLITFSIYVCIRKHTFPPQIDFLLFRRLSAPLNAFLSFSKSCLKALKASQQLSASWVIIRARAFCKETDAMDLTK